MPVFQVEVGAVPTETEHDGNYIRLPVLIVVGLMCVFAGFAAFAGSDPVSMHGCLG